MSRQEEVDFCRFMCRHLVSLAGTYEPIVRGSANREEEVFVFSGFVIEAFGRWLFVTAGHILEDLLSNTRKGTVRINKTELVDYFGRNPRCKVPLPFVLDVGDTSYLDRNEIGMDFGLILLRDFYREGLKANGIIPITRANWASGANASFDAYMMLGIPTPNPSPGLVRNKNGHEQIGVEVTPSLISIRRLDKAPDKLEPPGTGWFIGQININGQLDGMSGGPIFGFRRNGDGRLAYHALAVQSWWYPQRQVIFGCPIASFMRALEREVEAKWRTEMKGMSG